MVAVARVLPSKACLNPARLVLLGRSTFGHTQGIEGEDVGVVAAARWGLRAAVTRLAKGVLQLQRSAGICCSEAPSGRELASLERSITSQWTQLCATG